MGRYINRGNASFREILNSEYVDKTGLIGVVNRTLFTRNKFSCVTRCRRFGKSMAAEMLAAYYDISCQSRQLFEGLSIVADETFEQHLNKYPVIYLDITRFITLYKGDHTIINRIKEDVMADIAEAYPQVERRDGEDFMSLLIRIANHSGRKFVFIIDEWDAICREFQPGTKVMDEYVDWLRNMFKGVEAVDVFAGVYMTGILPIKKYKTQSALNNFEEYSMISPGSMAPFFGFTKDEVRALAQKHGMDFDELEQWYDGYQIGDEPSMFNPNSVMMAIRKHRCQSFWAKTSAFETVSDFITADYEGLRENIIRMLAGGTCFVDTNSFSNDISDVRSRDDVLTVLIHLGYLSYDWHGDECRIPNQEVAGEMENAVKDTKWEGVSEALAQSRLLLRATLDGDTATVARVVDLAHSDNTSILSYYNENSMACVLTIAFYAARAEYVIHRELATGKGFANKVLLPRRPMVRPAIVIELKFGKSPEEAIRQIRSREYMQKVLQHTRNILLVGISYDKEAKKHQCIIEPWGE